MIHSSETITLYQDQAFTLENHQSLSNINIHYCTYGTLSPLKDNAILICHPLTADANVSTNTQTKEKGWWEHLVGPKKPINTEKYFVICSNVLGSCYGSMGPNSINPETNEPYRLDFPVITISDMVHVQKKLLDYLNIPFLQLVIGGSMGGMQALEWSILYPDYVRNCIPIASTTKLSPQALAFDTVARNAIISDQNWNKGNYTLESLPKEGLSIARMIGHITYLSTESMDQKFGRNLQEKEQIDYTFDIEFQIESYLKHQGDKFVKRFDPNAYLYLTKAVDYFDLEKKYGSLEKTFKNSSCNYLIIAINSDWLYTPAENKAIVKALMGLNKNVSYTEIESPYGHDAFLLKNEQMENSIRHFIGHNTCIPTI